MRLIFQTDHIQIADSLPTKTVPGRSNAAHQTRTKTQSKKDKKRKDRSDSLGSPTAPSGSKKSRVINVEDDTDATQDSQSAQAQPVAGSSTGPKV